MHKPQGEVHGILQELRYALNATPLVRKKFRLIMEWEPGSDEIGDFTWPGLNTDIVVVDKVKCSFEIRFKNLSFGLVEFFQNPKRKRAVKVTSLKKSRVWLPYSGPLLWDVLLNHWCHLDHIQSEVSIVKKCLTCEKTIYKTPRWDQRHLVLDPVSWNGEDIFRVYEYSGVIFYTEQVKKYVENAGILNVRFLEDGIIPD